MLTYTFSHITGVSPNFEQKLRANGIANWDDFFEKINQLSHIPRSKIDTIKSELILSKEALIKKDIQYFKALLKPNEHWRLSKLGKMAFVDIETTGLSRYSEEITVLGIYDGLTSHLYVNGKNLEDAKAHLKEFDIIVTFNGKQFDMPFIEHHFCCNYDIVHLDLRYMLKELGFQGGLKSIESQLGINRDSDLKGVDGFEAVALWHEYKRGNQAALQKLLRYNEQDIVNLKTLLDYFLNKKSELEKITG